jgi:hypothetical protein
MRKNSFLWLLPLAAALFLIVPSDLSALTDKEEKQKVELQSELKAKGKLSNSKQKKLDQLTAKSAAEAQQQLLLAPPAPTITPGDSQAQPPVGALPPQPDTTTLDDHGNPAVAAPAANSTGLIQPTPDPQADKASQAAPDSTGQNVASDKVPKWVTDPVKMKELLKAADLENELFVGIGNATHDDDYQAIQMAEARARQNLAFQLSSTVKAEITDYTKNVSNKRSGVQTTLSNSAEDYMVGQQAIDASLTSIRVVTREKVPGTTTWWVIVTKSDKPSFSATVIEGPYVESALDAVRLMDERLEKNRVKSTVGTPVTSPEKTGSEEALSGMLNK